MTTITQPVYELWDIETGNLVGDYIGEADALLEVYEGVRLDGSTLWLTVALARVEAGGVRVPIAEGAELIARAERIAGGNGGDKAASETERAARIRAAIRALDTISDADLDAATEAIHAAIAAGSVADGGEARHYREAAQAVFAALSASTGVSIHVETTADVVTFSTPDETVAGLLAARLSRRPRQVHMRVIDNVYRIEFAVPEAAGERRAAS